MILFHVCRKNFLSSLRGEYVDFVISRFTFTLFAMATALVLYRLNGRTVTEGFAAAAGSDDYLGFMVVGTALYGTTHGILLNVSRTLMTERREGTLEAVLMIPFARWKYYGGNQLHQLILTSLDAVLALILALILGVRFHFNILNIALGLVQLFTTLYGIALLVSLLMITLKDTFFIQNTIIPLILIIGGYLFPVSVLPAPLAMAAKAVPLHRGVEMVREGVLRGVPFHPDLEYFLTLVPGIIFLFVGYALLPRIERRALEDYLS